LKEAYPYVFVFLNSSRRKKTWQSSADSLSMYIVYFPPPPSAAELPPSHLPALPPRTGGEGSTAAGVGEKQTVLDKRSRILEVVVVRRIINLGTGNLEWGGNGKGLGKGRSVYE
jgi:hypothetical protein